MQEIERLRRQSREVALSVFTLYLVTNVGYDEKGTRNAEK